MSIRSAYLLRGPGGIDAFERIETAIPEPEPGWVTIAVRAFGLNRSELFSRKGLSSEDFSFPRVLGLECVGEVVDGGTTELAAGQKVMALMGGMGRWYDGSYATHTVVPRSQVFPVTTELSWSEFGALPESYNTAWRMCVLGLELTPEDRVLVRGGTSALGMAAASIAQHIGCDVVGTTRQAAKAERLESSGVVDTVIIDGPDLVDAVASTFGPVTAVVECVGSPTTITTSCATMGDEGRLALGGMLAETWDDPEQPVIPDGVRISFGRSDETSWDLDHVWLDEVITLAGTGRLTPNIHRVFDFDELPEAHRVMESNEAVGKLVVRTDG